MVQSKTNRAAQSVKKGSAKELLFLIRMLMLVFRKVLEVSLGDKEANVIGENLMCKRVYRIFPENRKLAIRRFTQKKAQVSLFTTACAVVGGSQKKIF